MVVLLLTRIYPSFGGFLPSIMRLVLQRVSSATVTVQIKSEKYFNASYSVNPTPHLSRITVANIHSGLVALVGIGPDDGDADVEWAVRKLLNTRLFDDRQSTKPWTASVTNAGADRGDGEPAAPGDVLLVSQFTLYATLKGNKPSFSRAMAPEPAKELFDKLVARTMEEHEGGLVQTGRFGQYMSIQLQNEGPATFVIESPPMPKGPTGPPIGSGKPSACLRRRLAQEGRTERSIRRGGSAPEGGLSAPEGGLSEGTGGHWLAQWRDRFDCWWLALPTPTQTQLGSCLGALALHLGSKLDTIRGAHRTPLLGSHPGAYQPGASQRGGSEAVAREPGCRWLESAVDSLAIPSFPAIADRFTPLGDQISPPGDLFEMPEMPPLPIRLLPDWASRWLTSQGGGLNGESPPSQSADGQSGDPLDVIGGSIHGGSIHGGRGAYLTESSFPHELMSDGEQSILNEDPMTLREQSMIHSPTIELGHATLGGISGLAVGGALLLLWRRGRSRVTAANLTPGSVEYRLRALEAENRRLKEELVLARG